MKHVDISLLMLAIFAALPLENALAKDKSIVVDDFQNENQRYIRAHGPNRVSSGFALHFDRVDVKLTVENLNRTEKVLRIDYDIPPLHDWGNWLSIRREFDDLVDLRNCKNLVIRLKVDSPSNAKLRISLSDVVDPKDRKRDELWWYDGASDQLSDRSGDWVTLTVPLAKFYESYGDGTRHNDSRLDLSKISGYEINIIAERDEHPQGVILLGPIVAE